MSIPHIHKMFVSSHERWDELAHMHALLLHLFLLLVAVAAVPLWLSSLSHFSDQIALIVAMVVLGVAASVVLIFRGVESILKVEEDVVAFDIAYIVTGLG